MKKIQFLFTVIISSILFSSCYTWYQDKVRIDNKTLQTSLNDFFYEEPKITSLKAPTQVLASQGLYSKAIKIRWDEVPNANEYRIERAIVVPDDKGEYTLPDDGDFAYLDKIMGNLYVDSIIKEDSYEEDKNNSAYYKNLYFYRISAENVIKGLESSEFTKLENQDTKAVGWLLSAPQKVEASKGKSQDGIYVTWESVPYAKKYQIWRNTKESDIGRELLKTVNASKTSFFNAVESDDKGKDFYYEIKAILPENSESEFSARALGYARKEGATEPPETVNLNNGKAQSKDSLTIHWSESLPADSVHTKITYSLFRTSSKNSVIKVVKSGLTSTTYTDMDNLEENVVYSYFVQTVATNPADPKDFIKSAFSEVSSAGQGWLISSPAFFEVLKGETESKVILRWTPALGYTESNFKYIIYSSDSQAEDSFSQLMEYTPEALGDSGFYTVESEKKKFFRIRTVNIVADNLESSLSEITAPNPESPVAIAATETSAKYGLLDKGANNNGVYPVRVSWKKPENDVPYGYNVYRSTKPDSSFRKLNDEPIKTSSNGEFSFIDENDTARAGTYYYYKVISINELGKGKAVADEAQYCSGYGAITRDQWFREYNLTVKRSQVKLTLMHKPNDMDKLGSETIKGDVKGTLSYNAAIAGLGAEITMHYEDYQDFFIGGKEENGPYFVLTGNTDTTSNMSGNGNMHGTVVCTGMYPGSAIYNNLEIKGGAAGGGYYTVKTQDLEGNQILSDGQVNWLVGEE